MAQLISGEAYSLSEIFCGENDKVTKVSQVKIHKRDLT